MELITSRKSNILELQEIKRDRQKRIKEKRSNIFSCWINNMEKFRLLSWRMKYGCLRLYSVLNKSCDTNSCLHNFANDFTVVSWLSSEYFGRVQLGQVCYLKTILFESSFQNFLEITIKMYSRSGQHAVVLPKAKMGLKFHFGLKEKPFSCNYV